MTTTQIGPLTWHERNLVLDDRISRARRRVEVLAKLARKVSKGAVMDAAVVSDMSREARRELRRLEAERNSGSLPTERISPPFDLHAEQVVLASVLLNNDLIDGVMEILKPEDFYQSAHQILFKAMVALRERERPVDQLTLSAVLKDWGVDQQIGGLAYLSEIVTSAPITDSVVHYARIVAGKRKKETPA